jgi:multidrug efflux pump subunit AcrB
VFLRSARSTLISAVALPTSVIATFAFIQFLGFTLNMMTMLALSLSIGILIDDAIVVLENIYRRMEEGEPPVQAAREGASEIGLAVMATTFSIVAVFVPVAFMKGIVGKFFYEFGITVTVAVLISLFVSLTLTPMLSSRFLYYRQKHGKLFMFLEKGYEKLPAAPGLGPAPPSDGYRDSRYERCCWNFDLSIWFGKGIHAGRGPGSVSGEAGDPSRQFPAARRRADDERR